MIDSILQMMGFPKGKKEAAPKKVAATVPESVAPVAAKPAAPKKSPKKKEAPATEARTAPAPEPQSAAKPPSKPAAKSAAKSAAKPQAKTKPVSKTEPQPVPQPAPEPVMVKPTVFESTAQKVADKVQSVKQAVTKAAEPAVQTVVSAVQAVQVPVKKTAAKAAVVAKAVRSPSKLSGMIVPSMQQMVASTAAKASYSPTPPSSAMEPVIPAIVKKDTKLANNWKTKPVAQLTDAELLAMPDAEYMNEVQMAAFRLKLQVLKASILSSAGETTEHLREESSVVPDPADRATIEEEHALELRTRDRERKLLKKIEQSISRIDAGDYGYCDETGEPIGVGRLLARPTATLSLEAQQRRELKQKMFGD
jgi:DnaK suppressor protein